MEGSVGRVCLVGCLGYSLPLESCKLELLGVAVRSALRALCAFEKNWYPFCTPLVSHCFSLEIFIFSVTDKHKISASDESCQGKRKATLENETRYLKEPALLWSGAHLVGALSCTPTGCGFDSWSGQISGFQVQSISGQGT